MRVASVRVRRALSLKVSSAELTVIRGDCLASACQAERYGFACARQGGYPPHVTLLEWLTVAGFILSLPALGLAIAQLVRTRKATEAAVKAVEMAQEELARNQLLLLLPQ